MRILLNDCIISCELVEEDGEKLLTKLDEKYFYEINCESETACRRAYDQLFESGRVDLSKYEYDRHNLA